MEPFRENEGAKIKPLITGYEMKITQGVRQTTEMAGLDQNLQSMKSELEKQELDVKAQKETLLDLIGQCEENIEFTDRKINMQQVQLQDVVQQQSEAELELTYLMQELRKAEIARELEIERRKRVKEAEATGKAKRAERDA